jgi:hypothetical protein
MYILTQVQVIATAHDDHHQRRYLGEHKYVLDFSGGLDVPAVDKSYETYKRPMTDK